MNRLGGWAVRWYQLHHTSIVDGDPGTAGDSLHAAIVWVLLVVPVWTLPFGVIGARLGALSAR